jgi:PAS domain S-box-containing protein
MVVVAMLCLIFLIYIVQKESNSAHAHLQSTIDENDKLLKVVMAGPLYDGNIEQLNSNLDSFFRNPDIIEITLSEYKGNIHLSRLRNSLGAKVKNLESKAVITRGIDQLGEVLTVYTTANIERQLDTSRNEILLFTVVILVALAIVINFLVRGFTRPIDRLTMAARAMAEGDLNREIDGKGARELEILAESFSRMRDAIKAKMADLAENNRKLKDEIAQRREAEQERDRLTSILEATTDMVSMADPQGKILYLNEAGRQLLNIDIATELDVVIPQIHPKWAGELILNEGIPTAIREGTWSGETALLTRDGREIPVSQVIISHKDEQGNLLYVSTIMRDITASKLAEEKLRLSDERLSQAVRVSQIGIFDHDHVTETVYWSPEARKIYGWMPDEVIDLQGFVKCIFPGDLERVGEQIRRAHDPAGDGNFVIEHRIVRSDGEVRWISTRSRTFFGGDGEERYPLRTIGATIDVTERRNAEDSMRIINEKLESRVAERTSELAASRDEAERANEAKSEFLSRMSHELRTPLNAILGFSQLLNMGKLRGEQKDNVQEILHAGQHLLDLINEVLDLARIESGKFTVSKEPVPLLPLITDCLNLVRPQAEGRGIRVVEAGQNCGENVLADRTRLKQVMLNLLSNAVKYNRPKGSISIVCMIQGESLQIRISDTGEGITAEQQSRLFVAFERLDADQHAIEGTGIGLALSKRLVELMGGEIGVESTPGTGSTFWVRLPIAAGYAEEPHTDQQVTKEHDSVLMSRKQWDVLCIEDNPANMRLIESIIGRRQNIRLLTAGAPGLGLELAESHRPALILMDINLPDMDGYAVMQCLREKETTRDIPVVAISANAMPKDLARGKAAGFVEYLTKPLDVDKLLQVVDDVIVKQMDSAPGN